MRSRVASFICSRMVSLSYMRFMKVIPSMISPIDISLPFFRHLRNAIVSGEMVVESCTLLSFFGGLPAPALAPPRRCDFTLLIADHFTSSNSYMKTHGLLAQVPLPDTLSIRAAKASLGFVQCNCFPSLTAPSKV